MAQRVRSAVTFYPLVEDSGAGLGGEQGNDYIKLLHDMKYMRI